MFDGDIVSVLPRHSTDFERALEQASLWVIQSSEVVDVWNPETCPERFLPWLGWGLSVDEWDANWPVSTKREVVATSIAVHRRKGTVGSILLAMEAMGYGDCRITEGWQTFVGSSWVVGDDMPVGGAGHWAEYWITVSAPITPAMVAAIRTRLASVAPARCHLTRIIVNNVSTVVGGPWAVGDETVTVGATFTFEEITDGIAA